ncbi:MAG: hypothetical protein PHP70_10055 [Gallionella sp.]|nr:hypothetical protein [Gallionella sp.]
MLRKGVELNQGEQVCGLVDGMDKEFGSDLDSGLTARSTMWMAALTLPRWVLLKHNPVSG